MVSACLVGLRCAYDGGDRSDPRAESLLRAGHVLPLCPEQMGGLPTPRPAAEITGGDGAAVLDAAARVLTAAGEDVTAAFLRGAQEAVRLAQAVGAGTALLRAGSPACGAGWIHDGSFTGRLTAGDGVAAAALRRLGLKLESI
ncbi:MAG: DUF523 domain-containing protein [Thermaerobacter sp.]|nr:DUF523 domain-containing protein [Thermaerobacter sp.]